MRQSSNGSTQLAALSILFALALALTASPASAARPTNDSPPPSNSSEACLSCHATPGLQTTLPSGETLPLMVDPELYNQSVHGHSGMTCQQCHTTITTYPHPPLTAQSRRDLALQLYTSCSSCHPDKYQATLDSVHSRALAGGNQQAAICTDCHGAHDVVPPDQPPTRLAQTCERCHSEIYALYAESVHGAALIGDGNPDVPTCIDCHGVHDVEGPSNGMFHLFSPRICATCHSDPNLMAKYGITTDVLDTYVADFHGTTVMLFEATAPDQETNKPVCIDCHGVHDIQKTDDPDSRVIKQNLLSTCQRCHPGATTQFPASWLSHYRPSPQHSPLVYYVNLFYRIFIPTVIGGMLIFVLTDVIRRLSARRRERRDE